MKHTSVGYKSKSLVCPMMRLSFSILHVQTVYVMPWQVSKYISSLLTELKRSTICCQGFLVQIQGKMTLSLIKTIGYCFLSGLSTSKHGGKPSHKISLFNLRKCICYNRQNRDQIKKRWSLNPKEAHNSAFIANAGVIFLPC